ncbi:hypothetical protein BDP27DRAFT_1333362, partial [Rhodocollybia butyracea]
MPTRLQQHMPLARSKRSNASAIPYQNSFASTIPSNDSAASSLNINSSASTKDKNDGSVFTGMALPKDGSSPMTCCMRKRSKIFFLPLLFLCHVLTSLHCTVSRSLLNVPHCIHVSHSPISHPHCCPIFRPLNRPPFAILISFISHSHIPLYSSAALGFSVSESR